MKKTGQDIQMERTFILSEYGRRKLLTYADSFRELAKTFDNGFEWSKKEDRHEHLYNRKLWENRCLLAQNLSEMAQIMSDLAGEVFSYRAMEERKQKAIMQAMRAEGIRIEDIYYMEADEKGRSKIGISMSTERQGGFRVEEVADMISVLFDIRLEASVTSPYFVDNCCRHFTFVEEAKYAVMTGAARAVKENEGVSGDNYSIIESEDGMMTMLISDGMGSGEKACESSEAVLDLMEKLLEAGYTYRTAVNFVNGTMIAKGEEQNVSTLDICQVNLYTGACEFCKIGAAPAFIKRGNMVEQIAAGTLPLGIFSGIEAEATVRRLIDGDYVILLSDGILEALRQGEYEEDICMMIGRMDIQNPKEIAEFLLQTVLRTSKGHIRDDMTILVAGIWENA